MLQPTLSLTFSIHSSPGLYALLLGSGISRSAGIPTGYEVIEDLIRKVAAVRNVSAEPDPVGWYVQDQGTEPTYGGLLTALAPTPAERRNLLRAYFEPTKTERADGLKLPAAAHRAIAALVARGFIRVILTTNFDRLLETALGDAGLAPTIISSGDQAKGALPLVHSPCTVIKLHGDYLDTRILNTPSELTTYPPELDALLDRVFDEYGLVVCGWSADYDTALRAAIERAPNRRFTTYWCTRGEPTTAAQTLISHRLAASIPINSADSFFAELSDHVSALDTLSRAHPLSIQVAAEMVKRYIRDPVADIKLHDLVVNEAEQVWAALQAPEFSPTNNANESEFRLRAQRMETLCAKLRTMYMVGCFWENQPTRAIWQIALKRISTSASGAYSSGLEQLRRYPALLTLYSGGIAAYASRNFNLLKRLLWDWEVSVFGQPKARAVRELNADFIDFNAAQLFFPNQGSQRKITPISDHVYELLEPEFRGIIPDQQEFASVFDGFEYFVALVAMDDMIQSQGHMYPVNGRYRWRWRHGYDAATLLSTEVDAKGGKWEPLVAGFFGGSLERLKAVHARLLEEVKQRPMY